MIENKNSWPLEHWLIELCSKCTLECPRCLRQEQGFDTPNRDLDLDWFKSNFTGKLLSDVRKITWSGVRGDPIYAKHLLEIMQYIRDNNDKVQFVIITNGSYKTTAWWEKLNTILNEKDNIHFSIDGWDQNSNNQYRVNCDWNSIMNGVKILSNSTAYKTWAAIVFKFNQHKIEHMKSIAKELKFDEFQITYSAKFGKNMAGYPSNDPLQPDDEFVSSGLRHDRDYFRLSNKLKYEEIDNIFIERYKKIDTKDKQILPLCKIGNKGLYINASGDFYPCCWVEHTYNRKLPGGKSLFNLLSESSKNLSLVDKMNDQRWKKVFSMFDSDSDNPNFGMCRSKCSASRWNQIQATKF